MNDDDETYIFVVCSKALFVESWAIFDPRSGQSEVREFYVTPHGDLAEQKWGRREGETDREIANDESR